MAKTIFDYAREGTRVEQQVMLLLEGKVEPSDEAEVEPPSDDACSDAVLPDTCDN